MRGRKERQSEMLLGVTPDALVPADHPLRAIRVLVDEVLDRLSPVFDAMYSDIGRPSIPPEHLLKANLLIALFSVRSERQFCQRLQYDLLFKWFLDLNIAERPFDASSFAKNSARLLEHDVARIFFGEVVRAAQARQLLSEDHFSVDGTLLQAWASTKSYRPKDEQEPPAGQGRNPDVDFHGQKRSRETHASRTDPQALLYKKAQAEAARLSYIGHALVENRHGLVVDIEVTQATGTAEREAALAMLERMAERREGMTLGADKGYDTAAFQAALRERGIISHVAHNDGGRRPPIPEALAADAGYVTSQRRRKIVEEVFGWMKTVGGGRKLRYVGLVRNRLWAIFTATAYNLVRIVNLEAAARAA